MKEWVTKQYNIFLYLSTFFTTLTLLTIEITLIRSSKVAFGFNYEFFIIPLTLMGMGLGSIFIFYVQKQISKKNRFIFILFSLYVLSIPLPFLISHFHLYFSTIQAGVLFFVFSIFIFFLAGAILSFIFKIKDMNVSVLYFFDLMGAAAGVFFAIFLLNTIGYEKTLISIFSLSILAGIFYVLYEHFQRKKMVVYLTGFLAILFFASIMPITPYLSIPCEERQTITHRSNSFSQIDIVKVNGGLIREYGDANPDDVPKSIDVYRFSIDCSDAGATLINFDTYEDISYLKRNLRSIPYEIKEGPLTSVLVTGAGNGRDVVRSLLYGAKRVDATEINPLMIEMTEAFSRNESYVYSKENVELFSEDTRRFLETSDRSYDIIIDGRGRNFGSVGYAGNYPQYQYTQEGYIASFEHLNQGGLLVVISGNNSRRYRATMFSALKQLGKSAEGRIITIEGSRGLENLHIARLEPFSETEVEKITSAARSRGFTNVSIYTEKDATGAEFVATDDAPYASFSQKNISIFGTTTKLKPSALLLVILIITAIIYLTMLLMGYLKGNGSERRMKRGFLLYFTGLGFTFMMFQIAAVVKLSLFLGNPTYALGSVLVSILFFGGLGSISTVKLDAKKISYYVMAIVVMVILLLFIFVLFLNIILLNLIHLSLIYRLIITTFLIAPISYFMGMLFPLGLRMTSNLAHNLIPWVWGISGLAAVLGGISAQILVVSYGFTSLIIAIALFYLLVVIGITLIPTTSPLKS